jgi:DNA-binding PadR family transcriptional regulator
VRDWTEIGFSSIYYLLTKLRDRGLIAETGEPARGKARKVFAPTQAGFQACAAAAEEAIATVRPVLVGLATQPMPPPHGRRSRPSSARSSTTHSANWRPNTNG